MTPTAQLVFDHFPDLSPTQRQQFEQLYALYADWNSRINVISRKDIDTLYLRHVLHSLGIAKVMAFQPGAHVLDVGTGGGFPGIPLAILYPEAQFHLVDSIGKKITVVNAVAEGLGLTNVNGQQIRAEQLKQKYDFIVSRAVTRLKPFLQWVKGKVKTNHQHTLANGLLYLKGGDLNDELTETKRRHKLYPLTDYFTDPFFETKLVVYIPFN